MLVGGVLVLVLALAGVVLAGGVLVLLGGSERRSGRDLHSHSEPSFGPPP